MDVINTFPENNINIFALLEANLTDETLKYFSFPGYSLYLLPKYWKISSGILEGVKSSLITDFAICKEMEESEDKSEIF